MDVFYKHSAPYGAAALQADSVNASSPVPSLLGRRAVCSRAGAQESLPELPVGVQVSPSAVLQVPASRLYLYSPPEVSALPSAWA